MTLAPVQIDGRANKAMADQLMAADTSRLKSRPAIISKSELAAVEDAVALHLGMNVSQSADTFLQAGVRRLYREKWRAENQTAIAAYNERGKRDGVFGDGVRSF